MATSSKRVVPIEVEPDTASPLMPTHSERMKSKLRTMKIKKGAAAVVSPSDKTKSAKLRLIKRKTERRTGGTVSNPNLFEKRVLSNLMAEKKVKHPLVLPPFFTKALFAGVSSDYEIINPMMFHPASAFSILWVVLSTLCVMFVLFIGPLEIGFDWYPSLQGDLPSKLTYVFERFVEVFFIVDIFVSFRASYYDAEQRELVQNPGKIARVYLGSWFPLDLLSGIPFEWFSATDAETASANQVLRTLRLLRLIRLLKLIKLRQNSFGIAQLSEDLVNIGKTLGRIAGLFISIGILAHIFGCFWHFITLDNCYRSWTGQVGLCGPGISLMDKYSYSVYWAFVTLTTVGYGDISPANNAERWFAIMSVVVGSAVFAVMIGRMSALAQTTEASAIAYQEKMDAVNAFMRHMRIPSNIRSEIRLFYERKLGGLKVIFDENEILKEFPDSLRNKVTLFLNRDVVQKVPFFHDAKNEIITEVLLHMKPRYCVPNEIIIKEGLVNRRLYIIRRGIVEVFKEDEPENCLRRMEPGEFFGEIGVLTETEAGVSIRSATMCTLFYLSKHDLDKVLAQHGVFRRRLQSIAHEKMKKYNAKKTILAQVERMKTENFLPTDNEQEELEEEEEGDISEEDDAYEVNFGESYTPQFSKRRLTSRQSLLRRTMFESHDNASDAMVAVLTERVSGLESSIADIAAFIKSSRDS